MYIHIISNGKERLIPENSIESIHKSESEVKIVTTNGNEYPIDKILGGLSSGSMATLVKVWLKIQK